MNQHRCLSASGEIRWTSSTASGRLAEWPVREYGKKSAGWSARVPGRVKWVFERVRLDRLTRTRVRQPQEARTRARWLVRFEGHVCTMRDRSGPHELSRRVSRTFGQDADVLALHSVVLRERRAARSEAGSFSPDFFFFPLSLKPRTPSNRLSKR